MARNSDGNPMCIMGRQISLGNSAGSVSIKWTMGHLFIEFSKSNWRFSSDKQVPFSVIFDKSRHEFYGVSRVATIYNVIQAHITTDEALDWWNNFASSETMIIDFRSGNEPQWSVKMAGSRDALKSFQSCLKILAKDIVPDGATSPVPDVPDVSSQPAPTSPVQTVPIKRATASDLRFTIPAHAAMLATTDGTPAAPRRAQPSSTRNHKSPSESDTAMWLN